MQDFLQFCKVRARGDVKLGTTMQTVTEGIVSIFTSKKMILQDFKLYPVVSSVYFRDQIKFSLRFVENA